MGWLESLRARTAPALDATRQRMQVRADVGLAEPDYALRERCVGVAEALGRYFDPEVRGLGRIPIDRPCLLIGNHSGGMYTPDAWIFMAAAFRYHGVRTRLRPLVHNILFSSPIAGLLRRLGALPANPFNARAALAAGESLMIYPGGDYEAYRPFHQRRLVDFGGRRGFIRHALRAGVPVIPVTCHGSHETLVTLARGARLARVTGFARLTRVKVLPLALGLPFGLIPAGLPHIPLPSKITIEVGEPMAWGAFGPRDADDERVVGLLYDDIVRAMQRTLDGLYRERPNPFAPRARRTTRPQHTPAPVSPLERAVDLGATAPRRLPPRAPVAPALRAVSGRARRGGGAPERGEQAVRARPDAAVPALAPRPAAPPSAESGAA